MDQDLTHGRGDQNFKDGSRPLFDPEPLKDGSYSSTQAGPSFKLNWSHPRGRSGC